MGHMAARSGGSGDAETVRVHRWLAARLAGAGSGATAPARRPASARPSSGRFQPSLKVRGARARARAEHSGSG